MTEFERGVRAAAQWLRNKHKQVILARRLVDDIPTMIGPLPPAAPAGDREAVAWPTIDSAPSDGRIVWVLGGRYETPEIAKADGDWWRRARKEGSRVTPTHWAPNEPPPVPAYLSRARTGSEAQ